MTDPGFVAAAYAVVIGGLLLYVLSLARRVRAARRTADALNRQRARDQPAAGPASGPLERGPTEAPP